tara:strand:+ start:932 stop:1651 length:720 start_codon:yes stop_codon:yes gene_type:complete
MVNCFYCGKKDAISKCVKCKKAWFCNKDCQKKGWKEHKKNCKEILWTIEEENRFYCAINNLQESYKKRFLLALNSYKISYVKLKNVFDMQVDYIYLNIKNEKYIEIMHEALIYLKDTECDWRLLQTHASKMASYYKNNKETEWNMVLDAFYDQMCEETTNYRVLVYLGLLHCYYFLSVELKDNEKISDDYKKYYLAYYDLVNLYKSKLKEEKYIENIEGGLKNTQNLIKQYITKNTYYV